MFSLLGAPALSQFRLDKLLQALQGRDSRVRAVSSRLIHFVDSSVPLDESQLELLGKLLTYGPRAQLQAERGQRLLVTPRVGTVSSWSSKATDIAHVCGLEGVRRLERGTLYFIEAAAALGGEELRDLGALLHDRMTESLMVDTQDPAELFQRGRAAAAAQREPRRGWACRPRARQCRLGPRPVERGDRLSGEGVRHPRARSDRCGTDDVRAGEFRALPPQDIQRASSSWTAPRAPCRCSP